MVGGWGGVNHKKYPRPMQVAKHGAVSSFFKAMFEAAKHPKQLGQARTYGGVSS